MSVAWKEEQWVAKMVDLMADWMVELTAVLMVELSVVKLVG